MESAVPPRFAIPAWIDRSIDTQEATGPNGYSIVGRVGAGGMGVVCLGYHPDRPEQPVAIKRLHDQHNEAARGRFKREILANALIGHPNVLELYEAGEIGRELYLVLEFFNGANLRTVLEMRGSLPFADVVQLVRGLAGALQAVHEAGIVHRDIKPENILVDTALETSKLMDFGLARIPGVAELSAPNLFDTVRIAGGRSQFLGTLRYMSPEQLLSSEPLGPPSDVYSLGLVLYELLAGRVPFETRNVRHLMSSYMNEEPPPLSRVAPETAALPASLHALLGQLLARSPEERPCAAELMLRLAQLEASLSLASAPVRCEFTTTRTSRTLAARGGGRRLDRGLRSAGPRPVA